MAVDSNDPGASNFPSGVNISVPDLTVARPLDTIVEYQGTLWKSLNATVATYQPIGTVGLGDIADLSTIGGDDSGTYSLTIGAGAETATLADPVAIGQQLVIIAVSDGGGSMAITADSPVNQVGNTSLTFADVQDYIHLESVPDGLSNLRWQVVANDGVALA